MTITKTSPNFEDSKGNFIIVPQTITVNGCADLSLQKTVNSPITKIGETITYTLTVKNDGPSPATGVEVTDLLPSTLTYVSHVEPGTSTYNQSTGIWDLSSMTIASGATVSLTISATVNAVGTYTNTAEITKADQLDLDSTPNNGN